MPDFEMVIEEGYSVEDREKIEDYEPDIDMSYEELVELYL